MHYRQNGRFSGVAAGALLLPLTAAGAVMASPAPHAPRDLPPARKAAAAAAPKKSATPATKAQKTAKSPAAAAAPKPDPRTVALLKRVQAAYAGAKSLTADFVYSVNSVSRQQFVTGSVRLLHPNYARVTFSYLNAPAYPNLVACDGKHVFSFTPSSFLPNTRTFAPNPAFDLATGAAQASGLAPGGGTIDDSPASPNGADIGLWDALPIRAFFDPLAAIRHDIFITNPATMKYEGEKTIGGVTYRVLANRFERGLIAGGAGSVFEQRLYVGPDDLIHFYLLEFTANGRPGVQVAELKNIRVNAPLTPEDFVFLLPIAAVAQAETGGR